MAHRNRTSCRVVDGDRLRELREDRIGTQVALAEAAGVSTDTIIRAEAGGWAPRISTVHALARALDVDLDAFTTRAPAGAAA